MSNINEKNLGPRWYVAHTYTGYENKVKISIEKIVENRGLGHLIYDVKIPIETHVEINDKGEEKIVLLELKMLADVGLIGFPSVGKSSILARISAARPKIADYHFTTLSPNLGVVRVSAENGFVAADIPGLIEGASDGAGLGHDFLRHTDRCRLLLHVVDISCFEGRDPIEDIRIINRELERYSPELALRPQIILANKCDALDEELVNVMLTDAYQGLLARHTKEDARS